jgi:hypothetical protein
LVRSRREGKGFLRRSLDALPSLVQINPEDVDALIVPSDVNAPFGQNSPITSIKAPAGMAIATHLSRSLTMPTVALFSLYTSERFP